MRVARSSADVPLILIEAIAYLSRYNPVKGLYGSWLTPDLYQG